MTERRVRPSGARAPTQVVVDCIAFFRRRVGVKLVCAPQSEQRCDRAKTADSIDNNLFTGEEGITAGTATAPVVASAAIEPVVPVSSV
jgi:hypothetical protein